MLKKLLLAALLVVASMTVVPQISASASGWGAAGGNPQYDNTADGRTPIAHRCSPISSRQFAGDLTGQDGKGVNATIGFNLVNAAGQTIDLGGCVAYGYSAIVQLNHFVGFAGQTMGSVQHNVKGVAEGRVDSRFSVAYLPANATAVWIETYTRAYTGSPCGMNCAGEPDERKYGWTNRRVVPVSTYVHLTAPTTPAYGGTTGNIQARLENSSGQVTDPAHCGGTRNTNCVQIYTWSTFSPEGHVVEGWGAGDRYGVGQYRFVSLASGVAAGQPYKIRVTFINGNGAAYRQIEAYTKVWRGYTSNLSIHI
jgi:hypothetical protein